MEALSRWKIVHVLQHKSLFNGWRLHAACMYSANVIDPPPCSTRPSKHSSAASVRLHVQGVLLVVREILFLSFFPLLLYNLAALVKQQHPAATPTRHRYHTTEHQPFSIYQTLGPSSTVQHLRYRRPTVAALPWPCGLPSKKHTLNFTGIPKSVQCNNTNLPTHQALTTHFATAIPRLFTACRSRPRRHH